MKNIFKTALQDIKDLFTSDSPSPSQLLYDTEFKLLELRYKWFDDCHRLIGHTFHHEGFKMRITGIKKEILGQSSTLFSHKTITSHTLIAEYKDQNGKLQEYKVSENPNLFNRLRSKHIYRG